MAESSSYQLLLREGFAKGFVTGVQTVLLRQGRKRFGPPDAATQARIECIIEPAALEMLAERLLEVSSWEELLAGASQWWCRFGGKKPAANSP